MKGINMNCFTDEQLNRITGLVREIEKLSDVEKLFLYLQLPYGRAESIEGKNYSDKVHSTQTSKQSNEF